MNRNTVVVLLLGSLLSALPGCSGSGVVQVTGEVTVDGSPLKNGTVSFYSAAGEKSGPSAGAIIKEGRDSVSMLPGPKRVEIQGYKTVGQRRVAGPESPLIDIVEDMLPEKYNAKSELTCEVKRGTTTQDFAIKSH
jgi:hypothetical protein